MPFDLGRQRDVLTVLTAQSRAESKIHRAENESRYKQFFVINGEMWLLTPLAIRRLASMLVYSLESQRRTTLLNSVEQESHDRVGGFAHSLSELATLFRSITAQKGVWRPAK